MLEPESQRKIEVDPPRWQLANVAIRPVRSEDQAFLYGLAVDQEIGFRWRFRGMSPNPTNFLENLGTGVLVQFIVEDRKTKEPLGFIYGYNASYRDGWIYIAAASTAQARATGTVLIGLALLVDFIFKTWHFRRIYFEAPEFTFVQFSSASPEFFTEATRLRDHILYDDRYWDLIFGAIERSEWSLEKFEALVRHDHSLDESWAVGSNNLDIDAFGELLADRFELPFAVDPDLELKGIARFDSLGILELADWLEELASGPTLSDGELGTLTSVRDLYRWYCVAASSPVAGGDE